MSMVELSGEKCWLVAGDGAPIDGRNASDLIGETYGSEARNLVIPLERLHAEFLQLRSGIAGEVLQKLVNYGYRPVVLGDVTDALAASDALRDFVRESNRGKMVWFLPDLASLEAKIAAA
jgi:hypothetical protein